MTLKNNKLQLWLDGFIASTFMQNINTDYQQRAQRAAEIVDGFKIRDKHGLKGYYTSDESKRPVYNVCYNNSILADLDRMRLRLQSV